MKNLILIITLCVGLISCAKGTEGGADAQETSQNVDASGTWTIQSSQEDARLGRVSYQSVYRFSKDGAYVIERYATHLDRLGSPRYKRSESGDYRVNGAMLELSPKASTCQPEFPTGVRADFVSTPNEMILQSNYGGSEPMILERYGNYEYAPALGTRYSDDFGCDKF